MVSNIWKYVGTTPFAIIHVNHNNKKTKIETKQYIYYHKGVYPYHDPDYFKKYKKRLIK